jgi:cation diffusion facilitator CzcD-associated flavoprotein CzcO
MSPLVLDGDSRIGGTWARRYDRLRLHTVKRFSGLPGHPMPDSYPRYVPKDLYANYLDDYATQLGIDVRLGAQVEAIRRGDKCWRLECSGTTLETTVVVVATGRHRILVVPDWPGASLFSGRIFHAADYRNGREFAGLRAIVVGIGNSGAEIAVDLIDSGASTVSISVRSTPPFSAREIGGISVQLLGILLAPAPPAIVDRIGARLRRRATGDLTRFGLSPEAWGPFTARRPPVIDAGFLDLLRAGRIEVRPAVECFTADGVRFSDGSEDVADIVVAATGYSTGLQTLVRAPGVVDSRGLPTRSGEAAGLFFAGFTESSRGQLFESARAAAPIARSIERYLRST